MNIKRRLNMKCQYEESIVDDAEFMTESFKAPREIKCFKWGDSINIIDSNNISRLSDKVYMLDENVKLGDKLDGQVIISLDEPPFCNGEVKFVVARVAATV